MDKIIVVYWSGTGNTEQMAKKILEGLNSKGNHYEMVNVFDAKVLDVLNYDKIILGSPAMGLESLEEEEFEPFFKELLLKLENKKIGLFGSYGWGDGEFMTKWEKRVKEANAIFLGSIISFYEPNEEVASLCVEFGKQVLSL